MGDEAARLAADPTRVPEGSWVATATPEGRRISDVVCVFRSMQTASTNACFEALQRMRRVARACP
eukprot:8065964-Alexandrium_andersonii.AAC.1